MFIYIYVYLVVLGDGLVERRRVLGFEALALRFQAVQVHGDDAGPEVNPPDAPRVRRHGRVRCRKAEVLRGDLKASCFETQEHVKLNAYKYNLYIIILIIYLSYMCHASKRALKGL